MSGPGKTVAVVGDGAVGLLAVLAAKQPGVERIIAMSRHEDRQRVGYAKSVSRGESVFVDQSPSRSRRSTRFVGECMTCSFRAAGSGGFRLSARLACGCVVAGEDAEHPLERRDLLGGLITITELRHEPRFVKPLTGSGRRVSAR
jgi:Zn-dependent alcohol dehydrogenase